MGLQSLNFFPGLHFLIIAGDEILVILVGQLLNAYVPETILSILSILFYSLNVPQ